MAETIWLQFGQKRKTDRPKWCVIKAATPSGVFRLALMMAVNLNYAARSTQNFKAFGSCPWQCGVSGSLKQKNPLGRKSKRQMRLNYGNGAGDGTRTPPLRVTNALLYRLSYTGTRAQSYTQTARQAIFGAVFRLPETFAKPQAGAQFKAIAPQKRGGFCKGLRPMMPHKKPPQNTAVLLRLAALVKLIFKLVFDALPKAFLSRSLAAFQARGDGFKLRQEFFLPLGQVYGCFHNDVAI